MHDQTMELQNSQQSQAPVVSSIEKSIIEAQVTEAIRTCFDPEIPVNIYDLGLIYAVVVDDTGGVVVRMTLTTPYCPAAQSLPLQVEAKAKEVTGVTSVDVQIVWDPPWNPSMMTEAAKLELGLF